MIVNYPPVVVILIFIWILIVNCFFVFFGVRYFIIKKYVLSTISFLVSALLIFVIQFVTLFLKDSNDIISLWFAHLPLFVYIIVLCLISGLVVLSSIHLYKYSKSHISFNSIVKAFNISNEGFLYFDKDGACLLINNKMAEIAFNLTKKYILNGYEFLKLVENKTITLDNGCTYKFISKEITVPSGLLFTKQNDSQVVNELIALDVTELVKKNELLKEDNKKLEEMNKELISYNENMLDTIRDKEILSAKINIHNEMNSLVLQSSYLLTSDNKEEKKKILSKWENNALLLSKEAENNPATDVMSDLKTLADAVGVAIECKDYSIIASQEILINIFAKAAKESLLNIAKHTENKKIIIDIKRNKGVISMSFINTNNKNTKPIVKGGGLTNLEKSVNELGGKMTIINKEQFILRIEVKDAI